MVLISRISILIVVMLFGVSCQEDSATDMPAEPGVALPLKEGNAWGYQHTTVDTNGFVTDSSSLTMTVTELDTFATETGHHIDNFLFFTIVYAGPVLWTNKSDGIYDIVGRPIPLPPDVHRALPFPTFPGDSLLYGGYTIRTKALNEVVIVPAGLFNCVLYDVYSGEILLAQIFLTPKVGIIKSWQQYGLSRIVDELQFFQLN